MRRALDPFRFLRIAVAGWMNQHQLLVIDYWREENRMLQTPLGGRRLRFTDGQRRSLAAQAKGWDASGWRRSPRSSPQRRYWPGIAN
jgi:hypothetical protein